MQRVRLLAVRRRLLARPTQRRPHLRHLLQWSKIAQDDDYYWWHDANCFSWDQPSWHASGGYGQWDWAQDDPQPAPASVGASGAESAVPERKTEANASDDTAVPRVRGFSSKKAVVRIRILLRFLLLQMLLRRLRKTASGTCQKYPLRMMTLLPLLLLLLVLLRSLFWWKPP